MKIAIAYDWLNTKSGGGEATLKQILTLYPAADLYCLVYNPAKFADLAAGHRVVTSRLQRFPAFMQKNPSLLLPFITRAVDNFNFQDYDLVISVSSAWVKNITIGKNTKHICYCFSPARMIWDSWPKYLDSQKLGPLKIGPVSRFFITKLVSKIRLWDYYHSQGVDEFIAISKYISGRINKYYGRTSLVVYPPVELVTSVAKASKDPKDYYLILSVLSRYKNIELAIKAFSENGLQLLVAGDGPDSSRLKNLAKGHKNIKFLGRVGHDKKWLLLAQAKALLFVSIEDFGIAPVESIAAGTPVVALSGGGLAETINSNNGIFFEQNSVASLNKTIKQFQLKSFDTAKIRLSAQSYSSESFEHNFSLAVEKIVKGSRDEK